MVTTENTVYTSRFSSNDPIVTQDATTCQFLSTTSRLDLYPLSFQLMPLIKGTPIPGSPRTMQHNLLTELHSTRDGYIISSAYVNEDGYGPTIREAYFDFLSSIRDRYDSLKKHEPRLSTRELQVLHNLHNLLEPT